MTTTVVVIIGFLIYMTLYFTYGKKIERDVVKADDSIETPSKRLYDGVDFVPAHKAVLFGHHFSSIAGAGPLVGPAMAICWGWLPGLLWVWFGNVLIGSVHDYLALMASVRYDGKSVQFVASDLISKRTGTAFYWIVFFLLILVVAAFANVIGTMFAKTPEISGASIYMTIAAIILGILIYQVKMNLPAATVIGIILMIIAIWGSTYFPVPASYEVWMVVLFLYIIIAAAIPVNILLQPRDYLNSFLLYFGIAIGFIAAIVTFRGFEIPMASSFSPILLGGKPTPFWPAIPLVIACGSLSGFHSLVGSGTSSKQLAKESDGLFVGYGAMFTEGFLSTVIICAIGGFGYTAIQNAHVAAAAAAAAKAAAAGAAAAAGVAGAAAAGAAAGAAGAAPAAPAVPPLALTLENWGELYTKTTTTLKLAPPNMIVQCFADMVAASFLSFIPTKIVKVIAGLWISAFALTTLDTTNRLARYCLVEMLAPLKNTAAGLYGTLTNRWTASLIPAAIGIYLAWSGQFNILWPSFSAANQLIASIALMTGAAYVAKRMKSQFAVMAVVPAWFLWFTVTCAILWFMAVVMPASIAKAAGPGWTIQIIMGIMVLLNFLFIYDFTKSRKKE
ncbi:MAG TPA: carbon starvation protein A [Syntrophales bacterium]|nr:carbon starvation protein A [Syntrophales bacterium]HPC32331.1 carbon starvation protein A [Syntrophales bacterium]HQG34966.1 carbon starvation protein A [Syntrophales bacterium]HRU88588.1 carbon starvation protein A [Syntrophales bacterium]